MAQEHYNAWIRTAMEHGISGYEAGRMPQAKEAHERDEAEDRATRANMTKQDFMSIFKHNRAKEGGPKGFHDQEEILMAMNDPQYEKSEEYRKAIAEILADTPAEVCGVSGTIVTADGQRIEVGRQQKSEVATPESMLQNARREMIFEALANFDQSTAKGRYDYLVFLNDPANKATIDEMEGLVTSGEQQLRTEMLASQSAGHVARIEAPVSNAIDQPEGTIVGGNS